MKKKKVRWDVCQDRVVVGVGLEVRKERRDAEVG